MAPTAVFYRFGAALAIGVLIGLQREYSYGGPEEEIFAGVRTFALIALLGATAALISDELASPWGFVGMVIPMGALVVMAHLISAWQQGGAGLTTEVATLLAFSAGALCYWEYLALGAAVGVATTVLLSLKPEMHAFAQQITREDVYATLKFAVITVIVLPVLPNRGFGPPPLDVLNPYQIWLMVVLISGISFLGYVMIKVVGPRRGISLTGVLGGIVSSTPVTLSFAQRSQEEEGLGRSFALAIIVAWSMTFVRVLVEVATINRALFSALWPPLVAASAVGLAYGGYLYLSQRPPEEAEEVAFSNPFELGAALKFGLLFAVVLLISKAASLYAGNVGVYLSSFISGLPDADAVTLSMAQLSGAREGLSLATGARAIVIGAMSNTLAKGGIVVATGSAELRRGILPGLLLMLAAGIGVAFVL
jgi:uncharacterized membrane protein (DUF4010 family)